MFSDLVGSTALSARMDPEDLREVISAYQKCAADTVGRFGGFVAKYMGDGVLVYFGYPQAHEDDAERAVRAGLLLVARVSDLKTHAALQTRVGIATGLVVVGDLIGSGEAQERGIVGETPNLAARLQGIAEPNKVVIAEATRKLLGNLFEFEDLGPRELKGIAGPVRAWAALRPSSAEGRFEALHASGLKALVGREEELELLRRRWSCDCGACRCPSDTAATACLLNWPPRRFAGPSLPDVPSLWCRGKDAFHLRRSKCRTLDGRSVRQGSMAPNNGRVLTC